MNTTLTTFAVMLVLALFSALVAPLMVDWNAHRDILAHHIGAAVGEDVTLKGAVSVTLLPTPSIHARQVIVGDAETEGVPTLKIPDFTMKIALLPLLRGVVSIQQVQLERPTLQLWMTDEGNILWPFGGSPTSAVNVARAQIQRLEVRNGTIELFQPDMLPRRMNNIRLNVEAETLLGPYKATGRGTIGDVVYPFLLTTGETQHDVLRWPVSLQIGLQERLLFEGTLALENALPQFEGSAVWRSEWGGIPLEMRGNVNADSESVRAEAIQLRYGKTGNALAFEGAGQFAFDGQGATFTLRSEYLDGDRFAQHFNDTHTLHTLHKVLLNALPERVPFPVSLSVEAERLMLKNSFVETLKLAAQGDQTGWKLEQVRATLPGKGMVNASGNIVRREFRGNAAFAVEQPHAFFRWIGSNSFLSNAQQVTKLGFTGKLDVSTQSIRVQDAALQLNEQQLQGQLTWLQSTAAGIPHLALNVSTQQIDFKTIEPFVDGFKSFWCKECSASPLTPPDAVRAVAESEHTVPAVLLTFSAGKLLYENAELSRIRFDASLSNGILALNRFEVGEAFGGRNLSASGQVPVDGTYGQLGLTVKGTFVTQEFSQNTVPLAWRRFLPPLPSGAPLDFTFETKGIDSRRFASMLNATREGLKITGQGRYENKRWIALEADIQEEKEGYIAQIVKLPFRFSRDNPGRLHIALPDGFVQNKPLIARYTTQKADITLNGKINTTTTAFGFQGDFALDVPEAKALRLRGGIVVDDTGSKANDILGSYANKTVYGNLVCTQNAACTGALAFEELDIEHLRDAVSLVQPQEGASMQGAFSLAAQKLVLGERDAASEFKAQLLSSGRQITVKSFEGKLANGIVRGQATVTHGADYPQFQALYDLKDADIGALWQVLPEAQMAGKISVSGSLTGKIDGVPFAAGLAGYGTVVLDQLSLAGANPEAGFATLQALKEIPAPFTTETVSRLLIHHLEQSRFNGEKTEAAFTVQDGTVSLPMLVLRGDTGTIRLSALGNLSLGDVKSEARFLPASLPEAQFSVRWAGDWRKPERTVVVNDLVQLAMLRVLEEGSNVLQERATEQHEHGRLQRELKHLERMREHAAPAP